MDIISNLQGHTIYLYRANEQGFITNTYQVDGSSAVRLMSEIPGLKVGMAHADTHYEESGDLKERPDQLTQLIGNTLSNLPTPCGVIIDGEWYDCEDSTLEFSIDTPGTYVIKTVAWPYKDKEFTYENQP